MMPAIKRTFSLLSGDILDLSTEKDALEDNIGSYDQKWLQESKDKQLKQIDDQKRANFVMYRMKKHMEKH